MPSVSDFGLILVRHRLGQLWILCISLRLWFIKRAPDVSASWAREWEVIEPVVVVEYGPARCVL